MDLTAYLLPEIEHFRMLGYWILLLIALLESLAFVGMLVPGTFFMILFGSLAANGYFSLVGLVWFAMAGAFLGDAGSFHLGRKGTSFFSTGNRLFRTSYLERGKAFFHRHGAGSIFLGRFIGPVRAFIPFIAGLSFMEPVRFYCWDALTVTAWAVSHLLLGYFLGHAWRLVEVWSTRIGIFLAGAAVFLACGYLLKRFLLRKGKEWLAVLGFCIARAGWSISETAVFRKLVESHPRAAAFLANRFRSGEFSALPLTLVAVAFICTSFLLARLTGEVMKSEATVAVDANVGELLFTYRNPLLVKIFLWITALGTAEVVIAVTVAATLVMALLNRRPYIVPFWLSTAGSYLFVLIGKNVIQRQRPVDFAVYSEPSFSFPSAHAAMITALAGFFVYVAWRESDDRKRRLNILFASVTVIIAVGFSRLYLGVHYLSDILAGFLLGLLCLMMGICTRELHGAGTGPVPRTPVVKTGCAFLLLATVAVYIHAAAGFRPAATTPEVRPATIIEGDEVMEIFPAHGMPRHAESVAGKREQPLSLLLSAENGEMVREALAKAGWKEADPVSFFNLAKTAVALLFDENYLQAPVAPSFWNGRVNDMQFVKATPRGTVRSRHEARLWETGFIDGDGRKLYVGTANLAATTGRLPVPEKGRNPDLERNELFRDLSRAGVVALCASYPLVPPMSGKGGGGPFRTDGYLYVMELR